MKKNIRQIKQELRNFSEFDPETYRKRAYEKIRSVLDRDGDVNAPIEDSSGLLEYALQHRASLDTIEEIIDAGANLKARDMWGFTPLLAAVACAGLDAVELLVDSGASVRTSSKKGWTPMHNVAVKQDIPLAKYLLSHGASYDSVEKERGFTPLMLAAENGNLAMCRLLTDAGANPFDESNDGDTALDIAMRKNHTKVANFLRDDMAWIDRNRLGLKNYPNNDLMEEGLGKVIELISKVKNRRDPLPLWYEAAINVLKHVLENICRIEPIKYINVWNGWGSSDEIPNEGEEDLFGDGKFSVTIDFYGREENENIDSIMLEPISGAKLVDHAEDGSSFSFYFQSTKFSEWKPSKGGNFSSL